MLIRVDPHSSEPLFEQIAFCVKDQIARGQAAPGDRLPSVRELARELAINPNTVVRAYQALERDGVLVRRQGSGCFLTDQGLELARVERRRQLAGLLRRAATAAFHLGFTKDEVRAALDRELDALRFDRAEGDSQE